MVSSGIYPTTFGFKVSVEIIRDIEVDVAYVDVVAPMYVIKRFRIPHCYGSSKFSDAQILKDSDFIRVMVSHFP